MKFGMRTPSPKKSFSARTTGRLTRSVKKATNPLYGKKGVGMIKNPEKALKNKVYHKTTVGISDIVNSSSSSNTYDTNYSYTPKTSNTKSSKSTAVKKSLTLTDTEKTVAAIIINGLRQNGCATENLGLYKRSNGYVELVDGYPYIRYKIAKTMAYVLIPKTVTVNDAIVTACPASEGTENVRLMFKDPGELVAHDKLLVQVYRDARNKCYDSVNLKAANAYANIQYEMLSEFEIASAVTDNGGKYWIPNTVKNQKGNAMKLIDLKCPNCGAKLQVNSELKKASCNYCGQEFVIDDEVQHIQYDNAEQAGYDFEKGRQRAQAEQTAAKENSYAETTASYQPQEKTTGCCFGSCWTIFLWIFFFPIMFTIWVIRTDKIDDDRIKVALMIAVWALFIGVYVLGGGYKKDKEIITGQESSSSTTNSTEYIVEDASSETTEEEAERLYDNEDENLDAILANFNKFSGKKITKDMVDNASSNRWKCKVDFGDALLKINFERVFDIDKRYYYFSLTQPDGDAEVARPYYLALFQALYPEADIDTLNQMYDDMNAVQDKYGVDVFIYGCDCSSWIDIDDSYGVAFTYKPANQDRTTAILDKDSESANTESAATE